MPDYIERISDAGTCPNCGGKLKVSSHQPNLTYCTSCHYENEKIHIPFSGEDLSGDDGEELWGCF